MIKPDIPENECGRLNALSSYDILDTLPEQDYDDITDMAAHICETPMALVTLVDKDRQYFKSKVGITIGDTPRDYSFCSHAINSPGRLMEIEDTSKDKRFFDNPYVTGEPHIAFYAGVTLINPEGFALGTLCVLDRKPKILSDAQRKALQSLANQVINNLELRRKNRLLEKSQIALNNYARETEEFVYAFSHDIKEPVRMVRSFLKLLKEKHNTSLNEKGQQYLEFAVSGANRMNEMLKDLLSFYQLNQNDDVPQSIELNAILLELKDFYQMEFPNVKVSAMPLPVLLGKQDDFHKLFQNLIGNAVKYREPSRDSLIEISVEEKEKFWEFEVKDNGIGIPEDKKEEIFILFKRLKNKSEIPGTGIGLSICRKLVNSAGGEIWVKSILNEGSSFFFTWPKNPQTG